jgi:hypothetical protein
MSEASRPSSLHRLRRRINNGSVLRSVRSFSLKRKKPISIAIIAVLIFAILLTTILIVVLRQSGNNCEFLRSDCFHLYSYIEKFCSTKLDLKSVKL